MVRHQIELDEETDRALTRLSEEFGGDLNETLTELVRSRESIESFLDNNCEDAQNTSLREQVTPLNRTSAPETP